MLAIRNLVVVAVIVALGPTATVSAQALGSAGDLVIGAERMFGFSSTSFSSEEEPVETTTTITQFSLLMGGAASPYAAPRIAVDGFLIDSLSVGGTFGLATLSPETEISSMGTSMTTEGDSVLAVVVGARAGYAYMFNDTVGIWPHLGLTYFSASTESEEGDEQTTSGLAMSVDAMLAITPVAHFGFVVGPILDLGLTGSSDVTTGDTTVETDNTITDWGIQAGLIGWL